MVHASTAELKPLNSVAIHAVMTCHAPWWIPVRPTSWSWRIHTRCHWPQVIIGKSWGTPLGWFFSRVDTVRIPIHGTPFFRYGRRYFSPGVILHRHALQAYHSHPLLTVSSRLRGPWKKNRWCWQKLWQDLSWQAVNTGAGPEPILFWGCRAAKVMPGVWFCDVFCAGLSHLVVLVLCLQIIEAH